ncbi:MAG: hypothetical protein GX414_15960 [Acidobacteria bacterium]|nr:hypothetical protein [Acidobacteriota bacterium]
MRRIQIALFILGILVLLGSLSFIGGGVGDTLWRAGVAIFLMDIACIMLWPGPPRPQAP